MRRTRQPSVGNESSSSQVLSPSFFKRPVEKVARELVGKVLVTKRGKKITRCLITETEAYAASDDSASHAFRGKTRRNAAMFQAGGTIYMYRIYGIHFCLNVSTGKKDEGSAVLIRSIRNIADNIDIHGPGRVTSYLGITLQANNLPLGHASGMWVEQTIDTFITVQSSPRIGITKATEIPWRFVAEFPGLT